MNRLISIPLAVACFGAFAISPAAAQVAGTYSGTSMDGNGVSFTVAADTNTGSLAVTGATVFFSDLCKDGSTLNEGWGYGLTQDITDRKVTNSSSNAYFTINFNLVFSADGQSAKGRITTYSPTLAPVSDHPTKALFCKTPTQPMSLTLQPGDVAKFKPPANGAVWLGKAN